MHYQIRECLQPDCCFRYPVMEEEMPALLCPRCHHATQLIWDCPLESELPDWVSPPSPTKLVALLDNVRSVFNVGSIFRIADGVGISHLYLAGITPTPNHPKMPKTALGAEQTVRWSYHPNGWQIACQLREQGYQLWALEEASHAQPFFALLPIPNLPTVLVVGNERVGVDPSILTICDQICQLPMHGQKRSLNVAVAFGIAAYTVRYWL